MPWRGRERSATSSMADIAHATMREPSTGDRSPFEGDRNEPPHQRLRPRGTEQTACREPRLSKPAASRPVLWASCRSRCSGPISTVSLSRRGCAVHRDSVRKPAPGCCRLDRAARARRGARRMMGVGRALRRNRGGRPGADARDLELAVMQVRKCCYVSRLLASARQQLEAIGRGR